MIQVNVISSKKSSDKVKDDLVSEATIFEPEVNPVANSRHIYSQARKKLALLTSHSPHGDDGRGHHLHPGGHGKGTLMPAASRHWSRASTAIYHGVKATQRAKIATTVVKKMAVTKQVGREELLHEKFANLLVTVSDVSVISPYGRAATRLTYIVHPYHQNISKPKAPNAPSCESSNLAQYGWHQLAIAEAMNHLEERVAVRYGEAKQFTEKLRSMQRSLNPKDQLQAIDAAQSAVDFNRASLLFKICVGSA